MSALYNFSAECLAQEMYPGLLENAMLYYWLRSFSMSVQMPEAVFQKLERQWPVVVQRIGDMTDTMLAELIGQPSHHADQEVSKGLHEWQMQLVKRIDDHVRQVLVSGGGDEELLLSMSSYMGAFKQLMDSTTEVEMQQLFQQYDGFYRFAKLLESLAQGIADGSIPVPRQTHH